MSKNKKKNDKAKKKAEDQAAVNEFFKEVEQAEIPADAEQKLDVKYIKCPKCGADMPVTIQTCINCGAKIKEKSSYTMISDKKARIIRWSIGIVLVIGFALWYIFAVLV